MERHFEGKEEAKLYKRYRPKTHQVIVDKVLDYVKTKLPDPLGSMVDIGCGNGQNTLVFAPYFKNVLGTDISPSMIAAVADDPSNPPNVSFLVASADQIPVPDESVDLVAAAQCYHWLDHDKVNKEALRVLKPNGVMALIAHEAEYLTDPNDPNKAKELKDANKSFWKVIQPEVREVVNLHFSSHYANVSFPFVDIVKENCVPTESPITLADYLGVVETFSPYQKMKKANPQVAAEAMDKMIADFVRILNVESGIPFEEVHTTIRLDNFFVLGRK